MLVDDKINVGDIGRKEKQQEKQQIRRRVERKVGMENCGWE